MFIFDSNKSILLSHEPCTWSEFYKLRPLPLLENFEEISGKFTGKLIQSSIGEFWCVIQAVLLENSSRPYMTLYDSYMVSVKKIEGMSFPVKRPPIVHNVL